MKRRILFLAAFALMALMTPLGAKGQDYNFLNYATSVKRTRQLAGTNFGTVQFTGYVNHITRQNDGSAWISMQDNAADGAGINVYVPNNISTSNIYPERRIQITARQVDVGTYNADISVFSVTGVDMMAYAYTSIQDVTLTQLRNAHYPLSAERTKNDPYQNRLVRLQNLTVVGSFPDNNTKFIVEDANHVRDTLHKWFNYHFYVGQRILEVVAVNYREKVGFCRQLFVRNASDIVTEDCSIKEARLRAGTGLPVKITGVVNDIWYDQSMGASVIYMQDNNDPDTRGITVHAYNVPNTVTIGTEITVTADKVFVNAARGVFITREFVSSLEVVSQGNELNVRNVSLQTLKNSHYPATDYRIKNDPYQHTRVRLTDLTVVEHLESSGYGYHRHGWVVKDANNVRDTINFYGLDPQPTLPVGAKLSEVVAVDCRHTGLSESSPEHYMKLLVTSADDIQYDIKTIRYARTHLEQFNIVEGVITSVMPYNNGNAAECFIQDNTGGLAFNLSAPFPNVGDRVILRVYPHDNGIRISSSPSSTRLIATTGENQTALVLPADTNIDVLYAQDQNDPRNGLYEGRLITLQNLTVKFIDGTVNQLFTLYQNGDDTKTIRVMSSLLTEEEAASLRHSVAVGSTVLSLTGIKDIEYSNPSVNHELLLRSVNDITIPNPHNISISVFPSVVATNNPGTVYAASYPGGPAITQAQPGQTVYLHCPEYVANEGITYMNSANANLTTYPHLWAHGDAYCSTHPDIYLRWSMNSEWTSFTMPTSDIAFEVPFVTLEDSWAGWQRSDVWEAREGATDVNATPKLTYLSGVVTRIGGNNYTITDINNANVGDDELKSNCAITMWLMHDYFNLQVGDRVNVYGYPKAMGGKIFLEEPHVLAKWSQIAAPFTTTDLVAINTDRNQSGAPRTSRLQDRLVHLNDITIVSKTTDGLYRVKQRCNNVDYEADLYTPNDLELNPSSTMSMLVFNGSTPNANFTLPILHLDSEDDISGANDIVLGTYELNFDEFGSQVQGSNGWAVTNVSLAIGSNLLAQGDPTVSGVPDWVHTAAIAPGNTRLVITVYANTSTLSRTCSITIHAGSVSSQPLVITQSGCAPAEFTVNPTAFTIDNDDHSWKNVQVTDIAHVSNANIAAATIAKVNTGDGTDWLTLESWNASTQTFRFHTSNYDSNTATAPRSAKISVTMTGTDGIVVTHDVMVSQNPPGASMVVTPGTWELGLVPMCVPQTQTFTVAYQNADPSEYPHIWLEAANSSYMGLLQIEPELYTHDEAVGAVTFTVTYTATDVFGDYIPLQGRLGNHSTGEGATSAQSMVYAVGQHPYDINEKVTSTEMFLSGPTDAMGDINLIRMTIASESQQVQVVSFMDDPEGSYIASQDFNPQDVTATCYAVDLGDGTYRIAIGPEIMCWELYTDPLTQEQYYKLNYSQNCQNDTPIAETPSDCKWTIAFDASGNAIISPNGFANYSLHCKQYSHTQQDPLTGEDITIYEYRFEFVTAGGSAVQIFRHIDGELPEPMLTSATDYFEDGQAVTFTLTPVDNMGVVYSLNGGAYQYATAPVTLTVTETTEVSASSYMLCDPNPWPGQIVHTYYKINSIAEVRSHVGDGDRYSIKGIITCADDSHNNIFVQDETGGIKISIYNPYTEPDQNLQALFDMQEGDEVILTGYCVNDNGTIVLAGDLEATYDNEKEVTFGLTLSTGNTVEPIVVTFETLIGYSWAQYVARMVKLQNSPVTVNPGSSSFYEIQKTIDEDLYIISFPTYDQYGEAVEELEDGNVVDVTAIFLGYESQYYLGSLHAPKEVTVKTPRGYDMQAYTDVDLSQPNTEWDSHIWICDAYGNAVSPSALYAGDKVYFTFDEGYGVGYNNYLMPVAAVFSDATGQLIADTYTNFEMSVTYMNNSRDRLFSFDMPDENVVIRVFLMNAYTLTVYNNDLTQVYNNVTLYFGNVNTMGIPESWLDNSYMTAGTVATGEAITMPYTLTANTTLTSVYQHGDEKYGRVFYQDEEMTEYVVERPTVILSDVTLTVGTLDSREASDLVIEDGGEISITQSSIYTYATVKKGVPGYGNDVHVKNGWHLITTPVMTVNANAVINLVDNTTPGNYDLYTFEESYDNAEWRNNKAQTDGLTLFNMNGALYANKNDVELSFMGRLSSENSAYRSLGYTTGNQFAGWNLVGNPFMVDAYLYNIETVTSFNYYRLEDVLEGGVWQSKLMPYANTVAIAPMEGVFVQTSADNQQLCVSKTQPAGGSKGMLILNANDGSVNVDRAMVRFGEGGMLGKFSFRDGGTQLYIPQGSKDYAVVSTAMQGEVPVNFKASRSGSYTISVEATDAEMEYLHLIDNLTGADIDLLVEPSYTFEARTTDYASRFRLVFSICGEANGDNGSHAFAYYDGSAWVISNTGRATLQIVDVMGHILRSEQIDGTATLGLNVAPGVYMMRLMNGENVKTQKIVVR